MHTHTHTHTHTIYAQRACSTEALRPCDLRRIHKAHCATAHIASQLTALPAHSSQLTARCTPRTGHGTPPVPDPPVEATHASFDRHWGAPRASACPMFATRSTDSEFTLLVPPPVLSHRRGRGLNLPQCFGGVPGSVNTHRRYDHTRGIQRRTKTMTSSHTRPWFRVGSARSSAA